MSLSYLREQAIRLQNKVLEGSTIGDLNMITLILEGVYLEGFEECRRMAVREIEVLQVLPPKEEK